MFISTKAQFGLCAPFVIHYYDSTKYFSREIFDKSLCLTDAGKPSEPVPVVVAWAGVGCWGGGGGTAAVVTVAGYRGTLAFVAQFVSRHLLYSDQ